ncbi:conserved exported protein of unknown function [Burkholderia multivorans]
MRCHLVKLAVSGVCGLAAISAPAGASDTGQAPLARDLRAYMHGIGAVGDAAGGYDVFFSSSGLPPRGAGPDRNWTHDVYVARWSPRTGVLARPRIFIARPEAQEPVSVAQNDAGRIMVTFEDGWNTPDEVSQRYGVYTPQLKAVRPYPVDVRAGGHSGHAAAVGPRFVVFYSEDWVEGGGVDNLGTGGGVYARIFDANGAMLRAVDVAPHVREWWPMIAGSPTRALLVWQQYVRDEHYTRLKAAVLDPQSGRLGDARVIAPRVQYYTYGTAFVPSIDRFLVVATDADGKGFAQLVDRQGATTATLACMPASVREAGITVVDANAYTPSADGRLLHLRMTPSTIELVATQHSPIAWTYLGSVGLVRSPTRLHWVALSPQGLREAEFDLSAARPATLADKCEGA